LFAHDPAEGANHHQEQHQLDPPQPRDETAPLAVLRAIVHMMSTALMLLRFLTLIGSTRRTEVPM
jgi:hypothetical protein